MIKFSLMSVHHWFVLLYSEVSCDQLIDLPLSSSAYRWRLIGGDFRQVWNESWEMAHDEDEDDEDGDSGETNVAFLKLLRDTETSTELIGLLVSMLKVMSASY